MIGETTQANDPGRVLYRYFEKAIEDIGLKGWFNLLVPGKEEFFRSKITNRAHSVLAFPPWQQRREEVLNDPERHLQWQPLDDAEEEVWSHYRLQAAIVAILMGDREELKTLAAQLITEPMNRKLEISYFLGNLTRGKVGVIYKELPTKAKVLQLVRNIDEIQSTYLLDEIARLRTE